jgi:hypothetical protein
MQHHEDAVRGAVDKLGVFYQGYISRHVAPPLLF